MSELGQKGHMRGSGHGVNPVRNSRGSLPVGENEPSVARSSGFLKRMRSWVFHFQSPCFRLPDGIKEMNSAHGKHTCMLDLSSLTLTGSLWFASDCWGRSRVELLPHLCSCFSPSWNVPFPFFIYAAFLSILKTHSRSPAASLQHPSPLP